MKKSSSLVLLLFILIAPLSAQKAEKVAIPVAQETPSVSIFMKGNTLQLQNVNVGDKVEILSIVGVRVFLKKTESTNQDFELDLPKGYYIVKIGTIVRKISIK